MAGIPRHQHWRAATSLARVSVAAANVLNVLRPALKSFVNGLWGVDWSHI
jgi:hypothetical protein